MTINLRALSTKASGLADDILQHHDDVRPGTRGMDFYELLEAISSLSIQSPTNSEVKLVMDLARAKCEVFRAQKALAECLLQESEVLSSLLRFRVDVAGKTLDDADMGLGCMRLAFKQHGWSHLSARQRESDHQRAENSSSATTEGPSGRALTIQLD
ncbi:uncharacterized protein F5891DRAFT_1194096 [Suillus fuscotomentosus]|uniref:Uncharacterized protein n=1 Tax=Suillus fuscotomentosus TaxID=1912939 RepID=A0AAD4HHD8_9AGAM|nr:uncharacterized protein F5891DRAFT_1194096 [Suillus fuscotomentosus]KAG1895574.1 hypothetical protein F5891DRAFT_1194096 [Suillus fuscotomentosus]